MTVHQLRVVVEVEDYDAALRFYRDVLGLAEQESFHGDEGARVSILDAGRATLELSNPAQVRMIDRVETDGDPSDRIRLAFEVDDTAATTDTLASAGATVTATPRATPWRSLNARLRVPGDLQVTLFQELETLEERAAHAGFRTEPDAATVVPDLERELWAATPLSDSPRVAQLLAPEFTGIDEAGRVRDRADVVELRTHGTKKAPDMLDVEGHVIADDVVRVTWTSMSAGQRARRSSLWRRDPEGWRLVHHQATPLT